MKKLIWIAVVVILFIGGCWGGCRSLKARRQAREMAKLVPVQAQRGEFVVKTQATGVVEPENRVQITPSVNGRVEEIFVREGELVQKGKILAWLSSNERASLYDSVRMKGASPEEMKMVEQAYNMIPVVAQIDGQVIKRAVEPGQSVVSGKEMFTLSDRLIIKTQVDETDIGSVREGQRAEFYLDAFPKDRYEGRVLSIAHDSTLKDGVTVFDVKILPSRSISAIRSGMRADVYIITKVKPNAVFLPKKAVTYKDGESFLKVRKGTSLDTKKVETGSTNDKFIEIISGAAAGDSVLISTALVNEEANTMKIGAGD